jgi:hypothetical protein
MIPGIYLYLLLSGAPPLGENVGALGIKASSGTLALEWADVEHRLRGAISTEAPKAGVPFTVGLQLGTIDGPEFDGPVFVTVKRPRPERSPDVVGVPRVEDLSVGDVQTLQRGTDGVWSGRFVAPESGPHLLQISFRAGRQKQLAGAFEVAAAPVPAWFGWLVGTLAVGIAIGLGLNMLFRKER